MRKLFFICAAFIVALTFESCSTNFEKLVETGKYKEAERNRQKTIEETTVWLQGRSQYQKLFRPDKIRGE